MVEPEQTVTTWVFLGGLAAVTAVLLVLWSLGMRRWRRLLPELHPAGWTPSSAYTPAGRAREQFGSTFESATDPRARWRLYHELPDRLVAVRRAKYPRPTGVITATVGTTGAEADYDDTRVLLTGLDRRVLKVAVANAEQCRGRPGGADRFVELLVEAGAVRVPVDDDTPSVDPDQEPV